MPKRIQRKRTKGWKMPPNTVYVGRPTVFGNPFQMQPWRLKVIGKHAEAENVVAGYRKLVMRPEKAKYRRKIRQELGGKDLACWCPLDQPCHADVLLEIANSAAGGGVPQ